MLEPRESEQWDDIDRGDISIMWTQSNNHLFLYKVNLPAFSRNFFLPFEFPSKLRSPIFFFLIFDFLPYSGCKLQFSPLLWFGLAEILLPVKWAWKIRIKNQIGMICETPCETDLINNRVALSSEEFAIKTADKGRKMLTILFPQKSVWEAWSHHLKSCIFEREDYPPKKW